MISRRAGCPGRYISSRAARSALYLTLCVLLASVFVCPVARAQQTEEQDEIVRVETNLVSVPVFVSDARGRRVQGLTAKDFALRDDGSPAEIAYFAAGAEHVALAFLLDASGSTRDIIRQQQETALALFERFGPRSRVAVLRFAERAELVAPFTAERALVSEAFRLPALRNRRTAIFDAALDALRAFDRRGSDPLERRIIILISDGLDTISRTPAATVAREAAASGVSFYVIHLPLYAPREGRLAPRPAAKGFRQLAEATGGQFFTVGDARTALDPHAQYDLTPVFQAIADDLAGQYVLGFYARETARDGRPHPVAVLLAALDRRKLRVRALRENYILNKTDSKQRTGELIKDGSN